MDVASGFSQEDATCPTFDCAKHRAGVQVVGNDDGDELRPFLLEHRSIVVEESNLRPAATPLFEEARSGGGGDVAGGDDVNLRDRRHRRSVATRHGRTEHRV